MTETGSAGGVRPAKDAVWPGGPEVSDADAEEQRRDLLDDPEDTDPEAVAGRGHHPGEPPLEVSEADLADQFVDVPLDDDLDRD
jgi:hypothetical protein